MAHQKPRIGITMRIELPTERFYLARHYSEAVEAAGGVPFHVSLIPHHDYVQEVVEQLDGILLPGSDSDVDPLRYGREPHPALGHVHPLKDETDLMVIAAAERMGLPIFGICFGMQVLNVSRGGTLIQDIASQVNDAIKHAQGPPRDRVSHGVSLLPGSMVATMATSESALVNSHHHQAIETLGQNLVGTAWASDGLIEAFEDSRSDRFVMGVQWHPELGWERDRFSQSLFELFVERAMDFAENNAKRTRPSMAHT